MDGSVSFVAFFYICLSQPKESKSTFMKLNVNTRSAGFMKTTNIKFYCVIPGVEDKTSKQKKCPTKSYDNNMTTWSTKHLWQPSCSEMRDISKTKATSRIAEARRRRAKSCLLKFLLGLSFSRSSR